MTFDLPATVDSQTPTPLTAAGTPPVPALDPGAAILAMINNVSPSIASLIPPAATQPIATVANVKISPLMLLAVYIAWRALR
jgi:hypothetical protein